MRILKKAGRQPAPKIAVAQYLEMSRDLKRDPRFHLSNQDVRDGSVWFTGPVDGEMMSRFIDLLSYHNSKVDGLSVLPYSTIRKNAFKSAKLKSLGFDFQGFIASLPPAVSQSNGWYRTQCPNCARTGKSRSQGSLVYNEEGIVHCHSHSCKWHDVVDGFYNKEAKS